MKAINKHLAVCGILTVVASTNLFARELESIAPIETPSSKQGQLLDNDDTMLNDDEKRKAILVERLNGLRFIIDQAKFIRDEAVNVEGVEAKGIAGIDEQVFIEEFNDYISEPISLSLLDKINNDVVNIMADNDYPVVDVFAAEGQDITNGVVQVSIVIGKRGNVFVQGVEGKDDFFAKQISIDNGEEITRSNLEADVEWLNRNPFRNVNVLLQRGEDFGSTDIALDVEQDKPYRFYTGVDDTGTELTEKERWSVGANFGNVFGLDHIFNYRYTSSYDGHSLNAHSFGYEIPIHAWRHNVSLFGAYVESQPNATNTGFQLDGRSWQLGLRYNLPLSAYKNLKQNITFGFDYKRSNNDLSFGVVRVFDSFTTIAQIMAGYTASANDKFGRTQFQFETFISPGGLGDGNKDAAFNASRSGASSDYIYSVLNLNRVTQLPYDFNWSLSFEGQLANKNLIGSEQIGIGGFNSVRGYDEYQFTGDKGLIVRNELLSPAYSLVSKFYGSLPRDQLQLLWFVDFGMVDNIDRLVGEESQRLSSTGVGFRYAMGNNVNLRFDYGWQLEQLNTNNDKGSRLHASLVIAY
jgi:hemolysin activation/secretion protein